MSEMMGEAIKRWTARRRLALAPLRTSRARPLWRWLVASSTRPRPRLKAGLRTAKSAKRTRWGQARGCTRVAGRPRCRDHHAHSSSGSRQRQFELKPRRRYGRLTAHDNKGKGRRAPVDRRLTSSTINSLTDSLLGGGGSTPISRTVLKELQPSDPAWRPFCAS